jgi:Uma2 family endonuclease
MDACEVEFEVTEPVPIPAAKPPMELIDGALVQKLGGTLRHQSLEKRWLQAIRAWSGDQGQTLHEWRHQFGAPRYGFASLAPDVAHLSAEAISELGPEASEAPPRAPDIAVEILMDGEPPSDIEWKIGAYLAAGTRVVFVVDPSDRKVLAHASGGITRFGPGDLVTHSSMPEFAYPIDEMFDGLYLGP